MTLGVEITTELLGIADDTKQQTSVRVGSVSLLCIIHKYYGSVFLVRDENKRKYKRQNDVLDRSVRLCPRNI